MYNKEETPGPGSYYGVSKAEGPQYTMRGKKKEQKRSLSPGPGAYSHGGNQKKAPNYRIGTGRRGNLNDDVVRDNIPGPGTYTVERQKTGNKKEAPNWKFGS